MKIIFRRVIPAILSKILKFDIVFKEFRTRQNSINPSYFFLEDYLNLFSNITCCAEQFLLIIEFVTGMKARDQ